MAKAEKVLRVLLVEESVEDAEQVISLLRNAGIAVRPNRVDNAEQLKAYLSTGHTRMPDFSLSNRERQALVDYILSLR